MTKARRIVESWNYQPAKDLELTPVERARSLKRESGIWSTCGHLAWHALIRAYVACYHRLSVEGKGHLPAAPPFVLIGNHTSHLDSMVMVSALSCRWCDRVYPVAAGDVFFESSFRSIFSAQLINALPMWRKHCGPHALSELRDKLVNEPCGYVLFPEGTRSRDGSLQPFKPGLGMIVAGTPVPVIPCGISGAARAWPADSRWPRPRKLHMKIGPPLHFEAVSSNRAGWEQVARDTQEAVRRLVE
jgi:1-acyl-sn-glycerol-3-phosphate acyltransferase